VRNLIVVRQRIVAGAEPLVVPTCGPIENQEQSLCTLGVRIDVETARGWVPASLNSEIGSVPGGYPIEHGPVAVIAPGTASDFAFIINKQDYVLASGQRVRLRIATWQTEASLRAGGPKKEIMTSPFTVL
jgi:hypothetical protein